MYMHTPKENKDERDHLPEVCSSFLPAASKVINTFAPSVRHLIIEIDVWPSRKASNLDYFDFSPLAVLGPASQLIPQIDLYIHTDNFIPSVTLAQLLSAMEAYDDITRSIEEGILVIYPENTAPGYVRQEED